MKLNKHLLTILALAGAVSFGSLATAQEKKEEKPAVPSPSAPSARPVPPTRDPSAALARFLNLTDEQKAKVKPLLEQEIADLKALREDKSLARETQMAKTKEIRDATTAKIKPLLNDEQAQKWERIRNPRLPGPRAAQPGAAGQPPQAGNPSAAPKPAPAAK